MTDDFTPIIKPSISEYTSYIRKIKDEEAALIEERNTLIGANRKRSLKKHIQSEREIEIEIKLQELKSKREKLVKELESMIDTSRLTNGTSEDDTLKPYHESVGYAFGKCIYVDSVGKLLYRESENHEAEAIGETTLEDVVLLPFEGIPKGEQEMILRYLDEHPDTPEWFKKRNE